MTYPKLYQLMPLFLAEFFPHSATAPTCESSDLVASQFEWQGEDLMLIDGSVIDASTPDTTFLSPQQFQYIQDILVATKDACSTESHPFSHEKLSQSLGILERVCRGDEVFDSNNQPLTISQVLNKVQQDMIEIADVIEAIYMSYAENPNLREFAFSIFEKHGGDFSIHINLIRSLYSPPQEIEFTAAASIPITPGSCTLRASPSELGQLQDMDYKGLEHVSQVIQLLVEEGWLQL